MASMRDIKRRRDSISSTGQITKAMKLVSTVKLQKARKQAEDAKPFFEMTYQTVVSILSKAQNVMGTYRQATPSDKKAVVVVTSNRGLAGGYNNNIVKLVTQNFAKEESFVYAVGRKGLSSLERAGYEIAGDFSEAVNEPLYDDAIQLSRQLLTAYESRTIGEIWVVYTSFKNTVVHEPKMIKLFPIDKDSMEMEQEKDSVPMNFEPEPEEVLDLIIPKYITSVLYGAFVESVASENGARMQAMDSATSNAEEMIDELSLQYNRARQSSITQELTEIIGGAEALS
ncbi:MAG: ATP synthase F1 subunit gamma [Lachnospiraceae bacterium]